MKNSGSPIFNIFVRIKGDPRWLPAGSLAVERSAQIDTAIFQQEEELRKGATRLYPKLSQNLDNLEYGHQLKEFPDEEIKLAVCPQLRLGNKVSSFFKQLRDQILPKSTQPKYQENQNKKSQGRTSR